MDLTGQAFKSVSVRLFAGIAIANSQRSAAMFWGDESMDVDILLPGQSRRGGYSDGRPCM